MAIGTPQEANLSNLKRIEPKRGKAKGMPYSLVKRRRRG